MVSQEKLKLEEAIKPFISRGEKGFLKLKINSKGRVEKVIFGDKENKK